MNNTIAWTIATFIVVTIMMDLSAFILMKVNDQAYKQNKNSPRKGKAYYAYLVISRLAIAMTIVAGAGVAGVGFKTLGNLMAQHPTATTYVITTCLCLMIASGTWCATKSNIKEEQQRYDVIQDDNPLETFIDPKDRIAVNQISFWLISNIILNGLIISIVVTASHLWR